MLTDDRRSTYSRIEAWSGPARPTVCVPLGPGVAVVALSSGRRGVVTSVISPARAGRSVYVMWEGDRDLSLLRPEDVALESALTPRRESTRVLLWTVPLA